MKYILIGVPETANNPMGLQGHGKNHPQRISYKDCWENASNSGQNRDSYLTQKQFPTGYYPRKNESNYLVWNSKLGYSPSSTILISERNTGRNVKNNRISLGSD